MLPVRLRHFYRVTVFFSADDDEESESEGVVTSRQTVIEVTVPRESVGAIIGYQGSKIKEVGAAVVMVVPANIRH